LKNEQYLNFNSIGKYLAMVKTLCLDAHTTRGVKVNNCLLTGNFKTTKEETSFVTLNEGEINRIFNYDFSNTPYLDNARNWLIIGVWIGARVSDLLKLSEKNLKSTYIEYQAQKTGDKIVMPLHWQVEATIEKLDGKFPEPISNQKFNDYIKKVCQEVKINEEVKGSKKIDTKKREGKKKIWRKVPGSYKKWELVSTHICRRSFATNHYGKLPTPVIMSATGHKTEKMLLQYIGKAPKDNADVLAEFWSKQKAKQEKKPQLNLIKTAN
jgi:integrase